MSRTKYKVGDVIIGRTDHLGKNLPSVRVMIEIDSARYDDLYGHWIYQGEVTTPEGGYVEVEICEYEVERKL